MIYTHSLDITGGRAGVSKASGFIMRKMAEASKSGYKTAPKGFDYKKLANKAQSGINEPTAKNSLRSTYGASPFIAKYFSGLQNPPKNETIAQKNARLHLLADYLLRLSQNLVKKPTEANIAQAEQAVLNRQSPALREHFGNQSGPTLEITEEPLAVGPTPPNPAKHTKASLNALSTQQIRDILFALQGHPEKVGKKNKYSATPGKGQHKNKGDVIDEVLRIQGTAPAPLAEQNELVMDTGVRLSKAELDAINLLEGMGRYRGGGPLEDLVKTIEKIIVKGGIPEAKLKYLRDAVAVAELLGETELKRKVLKAMKNGEFEPLETEKKEEEEETGEPDKKIASIVDKIIKLVNEPNDDEIEGSDVSYISFNYFLEFKDKEFVSNEDVYFLAVILVEDVYNKGGEMTPEYLLEEGKNDPNFEGEDFEKIFKPSYKAVAEKLIEYLNDYLRKRDEFNELMDKANEEVIRYGESLDCDTLGQYDETQKDIITHYDITNKLPPKNKWKGRHYLDDEYYSAIEEVVIKLWNTYHDLSKIKANDALKMLRCGSIFYDSGQETDIRKNTINYDLFIEMFNITLDGFAKYLEKSNVITRKEAVEQIAKAKKPRDVPRTDKFKKAKEEHGIGSVVRVARWTGPELGIKDENGIEEEAPANFFTDSGARKGSAPKKRRQILLRWLIGEYNKRKNVDFHYPTVKDAVAHLKKEEDLPQVGVNESSVRQDLSVLKNSLIAYINKKADLSVHLLPTIDKRQKKIEGEKGPAKGKQFFGMGIIMRGI